MFHQLHFSGILILFVSALYLSLFDLWSWCNRCASMSFMVMEYGRTKSYQRAHAHRIPCSRIYLPDSVQLLSCDTVHACVCCEDPLGPSGIYFGAKTTDMNSSTFYLFPLGSETLSKNPVKRTGSKHLTHTLTQSDTAYTLSDACWID